MQSLPKDFKKVDALIETKDMKKDDAIFNVLENTSNILKNPFEGDGYSEAWEKKRLKRIE
jgi:glutamine synthetase